MAPGRLPKPPTMAAAKALMPMKPMFGSITPPGASTPAQAASTAASAQTKPKTRLTGMPT